MYLRHIHTAAGSMGYLLHRTEGLLVTYVAVAAGLFLASWVGLLGWTLFTDPMWE